MNENIILNGDALSQLKTLASDSIDMCVTSPPYWALRDYGVEGQLGLEKTYQEYITRLCDIFDEVKRVLKPQGSCWVNIGDTFSGTGYGKDTGNFNQRGNTTCMKQKVDSDLPKKCLVQIPSRFSIEMTNRGWILRNEIIWYKPSCMPSAVKDRFTIDFEKLFFFTKNAKNYYFETAYEPLAASSIQRAKYGCNSPKLDSGQMPITSKSFNKATQKMLEVGKRIKRCVWRIPTKSFRGAHFATYPEGLIETPIKSGCPAGGIVIDPFFGAGTTGLVALKQGKKYIGIELNADYIKIAEDRIANIKI